MLKNFDWEQFHQITDQLDARYGVHVAEMIFAAYIGMYAVLTILAYVVAVGVLPRLITLFLELA